MKPERSTNRNMVAAQLLKNSSVFYGLMLLLGIVGAHFQFGNLFSTFGLKPPNHEVWQIGLAAIFAYGFLIICSHLMEELLSSFRAYKSIVTRLVGQLPFLVTIYLAVIAALAEEILFRMAVQPELGLVLTALLYSFLHSGPLTRLGPWTLYSFILGLTTGWLYQTCEVIWPSLLAHILLNIHSVIRHRKAHRDWRYGVALQQTLDLSKKKDQS